MKHDKFYVAWFDDDMQIRAAEGIAALICRTISESEDSNGDNDYTLTDEDCADLGREILKQVLLKFRPDLFY
jgi:hypothetical protein